MSMEIRPLLRLVGEHARLRIGPYRGFRFDLEGAECFLVESGMGVRSAVDAALTLMDTVGPDLLVSFGIAGAAGSGPDIGDVVVSSRTVMLERGALRDPFVLAPLSSGASGALMQALAARRARLFMGTAVTTRGTQHISSDSADVPHPILEMETHGIARAASERSIPLLSLRAISDSPAHPIPFPLEEYLDGDGNLLIVKLAARAVRNPSLFAGYLGMARNARLAAGNAALAVVTALSMPEKSIS
jgi:nucleoside phosphorylase